MTKVIPEGTFLVGTEIKGKCMFNLSFLIPFIPHPTVPTHWINVGLVIQFFILPLQSMHPFSLSGNKELQSANITEEEKDTDTHFATQPRY